MIIIDILHELKKKKRDLISDDNKQSLADSHWEKVPGGQHLKSVNLLLFKPLLGNPWKKKTLEALCILKF